MHSGKRFGYIRKVARKSDILILGKWQENWIYQVIINLPMQLAALPSVSRRFDYAAVVVPQRRNHGGICHAYT